MKKMLCISAAYLIFGLSAGLFYHEAAYFTAFHGESVLRLVHAHALGLGAMVFFALPLLMKSFDLEKQRCFRWFVYVYNIGLIMTLGFMTVRGAVQLFFIPISSFWDHMIGGLAGIGHLILGLGICFLYSSLFSAIKQQRIVKGD